jgi:hypothetical protein
MLIPSTPSSSSHPLKMLSTTKILIIILLIYPLLETLILELHRTKYLSFLPTQILLLLDKRDTFLIKLSQLSFKLWALLSALTVPICWACC